MMENLKNFWALFDFRIPQNINDISAGFVTVCVVSLALIISIVAIIVLSSSKKNVVEDDDDIKYIPSKFIPEQRNEAIREKLVDRVKTNDNSEQEQVQDDVQEVIKEEVQPKAQKLSQVQIMQNSSSDNNENKFVEPTNIEFKKQEKIKFEDLSFYNNPTQKLTQEDEVSKYAIKSTVSYTTTFDRIKPEDVAQKAVQAQTPAPNQQRSSNPVKIVDGYAIINSKHRENLEKAYSVAVRKCIVNGTSEELEVLLDAKKYINSEKVEQNEFKKLLALISPK